MTHLRMLGSKAAHAVTYLVAGLLLALAAGGTPAQAQTYLPSVKIGTAALISPSAGESYYPATTTSNTSIPISGRPPEIVALARALKNNPDLIYQYVRNNIEVVWEYGLQKGALGASIDRAGTPFDQAALMIELLRQAGYTATYEVGTVTLSGTQFAAWTNITSAAAACQLLSNGAIPATINGTSGVTNCSSTFGSATVSTVVMAHAWVKVAIAGDLTCGSACYYDPSYKPYTWVAGINLNTATGFTAGVPLSTATNTMDTGTASSLSYVHNLNASGLYSLIQSYATSLLTYLRTNNMSGAQMEDVVGGGVIQPASTAALRQTALPYTASVSREWTGNVPDQYRTTLYVKGAMRNIFTGIIETLFEHTFFVDEIYGRRLGIGTNFNSGQAGYNAYNSFVTSLTLDGQVIDSLHTMGGVYPNGHDPVALTISAYHPYAASDDGTATTGGTYMDTTIYKSAILVNPVTIVHGWGDTGPDLLAKWSGERGEDTADPGRLNVGPCQDDGHCDDLIPAYAMSAGDFTRDKLQAAFLAQYTRAARLHAAIAGGMVQTHHVIGVIYGDDYVDDDGNTKPAQQQRDYWVADSYTRLDIDTGVSFVNKAADAAKRRAALLSIAATSAALEASVVSQMADVPDVSSTATRFEWGNAPPSGEDPSAGGARKFFTVPKTVSVPSSGWVLWENTTTPTGGSLSDGDAQAWASTEMDALKNDINAYTAAGYDVTASQESFLGPGQRGGYVKVTTTSNWSPAYTKQRGGAFIATKYVNGEPVAIAHDVVGVIAGDSYGVIRPAKGGGGGVQPNVAATYSPADPADVLKSRFVDRSNALGVNLANGSITYQSPAALELGTGGFPFSLSAGFSWHAGALPTGTFGPIVPSGPIGWVHNWYNNLAISGSGMEGMGVSDVRAAAGTIAAFKAEQDIFSATPSAQRDVAAALTQSWLTKQYSGNEVTVTVGGGSRQFVRLADNSWIAPGASYGRLVQTGTRSPFEMRCNRDHLGPQYALTRGWDNSYLSFAVYGTHGDQQNFGYWLQHATASTGPSSFCDRVTGFRLNSWQFPNGVNVNLTYANDTPTADGASRSTSPHAATAYPSSTTLLTVSNNLGRTLTFGLNVGTGQPTVSDGSRTLTGPNQFGGTTTTDPAGNVTTFAFTAVTQSATQRPVPYGLFYRVYTADNPSQPNVQYDYDGTGAVYQVHDANNLQIGGYGVGTGGRDPWTFFIAPGWRGERDDPLAPHDTSNKGYVVYYDTYRHPFRYLDELGRETDATADGRSRVTSYTYPEGDKELFTYDERNNALTMTKVAKPGSGLANITASVAYNEGTQVWVCGNSFTCNKPATQTDVLGRITTFTWDTLNGLQTRIVRPALVSGGNQPQTDYGYTSFGSPTFKLLTSVAQKSGGAIGATGTITTVFTYNSSNYYVPASSTTDSGGLGYVTAYTYDAIGNPTRIDGPRGDVTDASDFTWNANRREIFGIEADPDGAGAHPRPAYKTTFDVVGRPILVQQGTATDGVGSNFSAIGASATITYDPAGNKVRESTGTRVTQFAYDGANQLLCTAVRLNPSVFGSLPDACTLSTTGAYGQDRIIKVIYDASGQVRQEVRAFGTSSQETYATYKYSPNGKQIAVADADAGIAIGVANAEALNAAVAAAHQTNYTYDGYDRLIQTQFADGTTEQVSYYASGALCSGDGQPCTRTNRSGQVFTMTYDPANRLTVKTVPAGDGAALAHTVTTTYDLLGQATNIGDVFSDSTSNIIINSFDSVGRLSYSTRITPAMAGRTVSYQYDAAGNRTRLQWPDGYFINYSYDALNHPTTVVDPDGTTLATYLYDDLARRASLQYNGTTGAKMLYSWSSENDLLTLQSDFAGTANDVSFTNTFSPSHQWATATISNAAFKYSPATTTAASYVADGLNRYSTLGTTTLLYDLRGNYTGQPALPNVFSYDAENRMTTLGAPFNTTYAYDSMGRRTSKTVAGTTTNYLHDGDSEIAEYDASGALQRRFVPGPALNDYIAMVTLAGTKTFFHVDKMGSVIAMSDMSGNLAEGPYLYDPYGACRTSGGSLCSGGVPFRYTGQRLDPETGLYYYHARIYSPAIGRFFQTDPVGYKVDLNLYTYGHNDPTDLSDPTGNDPGDNCLGPWCRGALGMWWSNSEAQGMMHPTLSEKDIDNVTLAVNILLTIATLPEGGEGGELAIMGERTIVALGHYPTYLKVAERYGYKVFNIPEKAWNVLKTQGEEKVWAVNRAFILAEIKAGAIFKLTTALVKESSFYRSELELLNEYGYVATADGEFMVPAKYLSSGGRPRAVILKHGGGGAPACKPGASVGGQKVSCQTPP